MLGLAFHILLFLLPFAAHASDFTWTQILPDLSSDSSSPEVQLFPNGSGVAIWTESMGTVLKGASFDTLTKTWETPITINTSTDSVTEYALSISPDGFAMAVWAETASANPSSESVWASFYKLSDHSWTFFGEVNVFLIGLPPLRPLNAFIGNDLSVVSWVFGNGSGSDFYSAAYSFFDVNMEMFGDLHFISTIYNQNYPSVQGETGSSNAIMLYLKGEFGDPTSNQVEAVVIQPNASPSLFTDISSTGLDDIAPTFSMNLSGQGICGWIESGQISVSYLTDFDNNTWAAPQLFADPSGITVAPISAMSSNGSGAIAWLGDVMGESVLQLAFFDSNGATWSSPINISDPSSSASSPSITVTEIGRFGLVWVQDGILQSRIYDEGAWAPPLTSTATPIPGGSGGSFPSVSFAEGAHHLRGVCVWEGMSVDSAYLSLFIPPVTLSGQQVLYRYPVQGDLVNQLSWSATVDAIYYKVFRGNLDTQIAQTTNLFYNDHQRVPYQTVTYYVSSIDSDGDNSGDLNSITIPPLTHLQ